MSKTKKPYQCSIFERDVGDLRRGKGFMVKVKTATDDPSKYELSYNGFVEFENYEDFMCDLYTAINCQTAVRLAAFKKKPFERSYRKHDICKDCSTSDSCIHTKLFSEAMEINFTLSSITKCPLCGGELTQLRKSKESKEPDILTIHDVRMSGHPARLCIRKRIQWKCKHCDKTKSNTRIPGIQYIERGKFTMRLLRSIFELSIDEVPYGFIAEGYDLNRDYVGQLCRDFMARSEQEFVKRRDKVLADMPSGAFYSEPVFLKGKQYQAIFSAEKDMFYTVLSEEDICIALQCCTFQDLPLKTMKASRRRPASLYAFSVLPPLHRQMASGLFEVMQAAQVECRFKIFDNNSPYFPVLVAERLRKVVNGETIDLNELHDFLSNKENFRAINSFGNKTFLYRTLKKAAELAAFLQHIMKDIPQLYRSEDETINNNIIIHDLLELEQSLTESGRNKPRLPVTEAMELASASSPYSLSEQLMRLQFYNELALFPNWHNANYVFPVMDSESGMPWLTHSLLGRGLPVTCLEHLLCTGLLQQKPGGTNCFRYRQKKGEDCCTLECPFL